MIIASFDIGIKNLAWCVINFNTEGNEMNNETNSETSNENTKLYEIIDWRCESLSNSNKGIVLENLCSSIINLFDSDNHLKSAEHIVIEQQPTRNPMMKNISVMVFTYFVIKKLKDINSSIKKVLFYSPKNKLKIYDGPEIVCNLKSKYSQRKKIGIEHTRYFIDKYATDWKELFNKSKKKDDLADSFLQCICYKYGKVNNTNSGTKLKYKCRRKPTEKQFKTGNFTKPSICYILSKIKELTWKCVDEEFNNCSKNLIKSINKILKINNDNPTVEEIITHLNNNK